MIRFNNLKIYILATEAKPGGNIGAMLSPYLFSVNMSDFCKKFNEQSKDYLNSVWLPVLLYCDIVDKYYTFKIKNISIALILNHMFTIGKLNILNLYDLVKYYSFIYQLSMYKSSLLIFSIIKTFKKKYMVIFLADSLKQKINVI